MDELTMERYGAYLPLRELRTRPRPLGASTVDWRVIYERQRILDEALRPKRGRVA